MDYFTYHKNMKLQYILCVNHFAGGINITIWKLQNKELKLYWFGGIREKMIFAMQSLFLRKSI